MSLPQANPNLPLYAKKNADGSTTYYQMAHPSLHGSIATVPEENIPAPKLSKSRTVNVSSALIFYINQKKHVVADLDPRTTLNEYIRSCYGLTGTKKMCGEGGCGACTVMIRYIDYNTGLEVKTSINSCLAPLYTMDGKSITTIEGVGNKKDGYSDVQQQLANCNGSQCGFCSPGWVMQMHTLLENEAEPTEQMIEDHFDGNLCRCTGYRPILDAFKSFASDYDPTSSRCKTKGQSCCATVDIEDMCSPKKTKKEVEVNEVDMFLRKAVTTPREVSMEKNGSQWFHPTSLESLYDYMSHYSNGSKNKLVVGNTSVGIFKDTANADVFIYVRDVKELNEIEVTPQGIVVGGAITISKLIETLEQVYCSPPSGVSASHFPVIIKHLYRVANFQVRNAASWAGNVMLAKMHENFPSDIFTVLMGAGATLLLGSYVQGDTEIHCSFLDFLKTDMRQRIILSFFLPFSQSPQEVFQTYKVSQRHENAHAYVNAAMKISVDPSSGMVSGLPILAFGGITAHAMRASNTEAYLEGKLLNQETLTTACNTLAGEIQPDTEPGDVLYRSQLPVHFFYKFFLSLIPSIPSSLQSVVTPYHRAISSGQIEYDTNPIEYPVSEYIPKISGILQTSGEANYTDDTPVVNGTLYACFVTSTNASALISSIDPSQALSMPGVVDFISAADIPGENNCDTNSGVAAEYREPVFADNEVLYFGQPLGLIVADSQSHADEAANYVQVVYSNSTTPILSIQQAIEENSFFPEPVPALSVGAISSGDVTTGLAQSDQVFSGVIESPSQYHFHMETHQCVVVPEEDGRLTMHISTQWPAMVQSTISRVLAMDESRITVGLKRVGGSYGAKILRSCIVGCAASVAAHKLNRPIRLIMSLNQNMGTQGKRHPYETHYTIGVMNDGSVNALQMMYYNNGGATYDGTIGSMNQCLETSDNVYYFPNFSADGKCCRTNLPTNTYMRAPGCLPAIYVAEEIMIETARKMNMDPDVFRQQNFYSQGQSTPYDWTMGQIWDQIQADGSYQDRKNLVAAFNSQNRWVKKGISLMPMKYGIGWRGVGYGALINVCSDGTVQLSHSGCEVGQGIDTKVAQVLAFELGIELSLITVTSTNTQKQPNGSPTGGSITSGLCGRAVIGAARKLNAKLKPIRAILPADTDWKTLVGVATDAGLGLQSRFYNWGAGRNVPGPYQYSSYGAAIAECRVDILTGEVQVERVDILFDCGTSLNPAIDIGQVEGGFVQGMGLYLTEKLIYKNTGEISTNGTWEYKPPSTKDIPIDFRCSLLSNAPNPDGVLSSKASGEPPMTLAASVYFAVKEAIIEARTEAGLGSTFDFAAPACPNVIGVAAGVSIPQLNIS